MNNPQTRGTSFAEDLTLLHLALYAIGLLIASAGTLWLQGATWLVKHQILVPSSAHPLIEFPGTNGAGTDLPRTAIVVAALAAALAVAISAVRRAFIHYRQQALA